jgi:hypothetical protein
VVVRAGARERRVADRRIWVGSDGVLGDAALTRVRVGWQASARWRIVGVFRRPSIAPIRLRRAISARGVPHE